MINKTALTIIRIGLALVFLANAITAFFFPQEFTDIVESSFLPHLLPLSISTFVLIIGFNDSLLTLLILVNKFQKYIFLWAMLWLIVVMAVTKEIPGILEHLGFFSVALALWVSALEKNDFGL